MSRVWAARVAAAALAVVAASATESFEVASIRRSDDESGRPALQFTPDGGVRAANVTLKLLIEAAYDVRSDQVAGGPRWADTDRYVVTAKGSGAADLELARIRLQNLLADRFQLRVRHERKQASGYALTVVKEGARVSESATTGAPKLIQRGRWDVVAEGVEMRLLARFLAVRVGPVSDATGLTGRYDFRLEWAPDLSDSPDPQEVDSRATAALFRALREQLGLSLEPERAAVELIVVEGATPPGQN